MAYYSSDEESYSCVYRNPDVNDDQSKSGLDVLGNPVLRWAINPIVTMVISSSGEEMMLAEMWANGRVISNLGIEFLFLDQFHLDLPGQPNKYGIYEKIVASRASRNYNPFPIYPHVGVNTWSYSKISVDEAYERSPAQCHRTWNLMGLPLDLDINDPLGGVIDVRGYDDRNRLTVEIMIPPTYVWGEF